jgi:hypothetical protein
MDVADGARVRLHIGPLRLWVERAEREWSMAVVRGDDPLDGTVDLQSSGSVELPPDEAERERVAVTRTASPLHLGVALPDRPMVVRPEVPWSLLAGHEATFYARFPSWVSLAQGPEREEIARMATFRPSDTWFGPSSTEGELCYALRTRARPDLTGLPHVPFRIVTRVHVVNRATDALVVERIKLPTDQLTLYASRDGLLGTDEVRVVREEDGRTVRVRTTGVPLPEVQSSEVLVAPPKPRRGGVLGGIGAWLR